MPKEFLTYNQQMRYLRDEKKISCIGTKGKEMLVTTGYFNLVNGYKTPFVLNCDANGKHTYFPGTTIDELYSLKSFDDNLRIFIFRYITKVEEEVRSLAAYSFDYCNNRGEITWYRVEAYDTTHDIQKVVKVISDTFSEINRSKQEYVNYYLENHKSIPTWIVVKTINFSTFIDLISYGKLDVKNALCTLYGFIDNKGNNDYKLLIGSLHWLRKIRNSCAHNERIYTMCRNNGRILSPYFDLMGKSYMQERNQKIIDLIVFFKYYLTPKEFENLIAEFKCLLEKLQKEINPQAFERVRANIGLKDIQHLDKIVLNPKEIFYNKHS